MTIRAPAATRLPSRAAGRSGAFLSRREDTWCCHASTAFLHVLGIRFADRPRPDARQPHRPAKARRGAGWFGLAFAGALLWASPLAAQVIITGLADIPLGRWNGASDLQGEDSHCVMAPRGGKFTIEAKGDGPGNTFVLHNGAFTLPYEVSYDDGSGWSRMTAGVPLTGQRGQPNSNQLERCLSGRRSPERIRVRVLARDLGTAIAGGYSGRLTLLVAAE